MCRLAGRSISLFLAFVQKKRCANQMFSLKGGRWNLFLRIKAVPCWSLTVSLVFLFRLATRVPPDVQQHSVYLSMQICCLDRPVRSERTDGQHRQFDNHQHGRRRNKWLPQRGGEQLRFRSGRRRTRVDSDQSQAVAIKRATSGRETSGRR